MLKLFIWIHRYCRIISNQYFRLIDEINIFCKSTYPKNSSDNQVNCNVDIIKILKYWCIFKAKSFYMLTHVNKGDNSYHIAGHFYWWMNYWTFDNKMLTWTKHKLHLHQQNGRWQQRYSVVLKMLFR